MMQSFKFRLIPIALLTFLVFLSGCGKDNSAFREQSASPKGVMAEDFLPEDIALFFAFNTFSGDQKSFFDSLKSQFPESKDGGIASILQNTLSQNFQSLDLSYEEDVKPVLGDKNRFVFALAGSNLNEPYVSFVVNNEELFSQLVSKLEKQNGYSRENYREGVVFGSGQLYGAQYQDVVLFVSTQEKAKQALDRVFDKKSHLSSSRIFKDLSARKEGAYLSYIYMDAAAFLKILSQSLQEAGQAGNDPFANSPFLSYIQGYSIFVQAESDGLSVNGYVLTDAKKMKKDKTRFTDFRGDGKYFIDTLPADKLIFYSEAHNLKQELELILKNSNLNSGAGFSKTQIETFATNYLGLNFEKDVLPWMDGPYTFSMYRNESSVIPGIVFIVDASASLEAARTFVSSISSKIALAAAALSPQIPLLKDALQIGTVDVGEDSLSTIGFDFSKISESDLPVSVIPPSLLKESLSLYYGVLGNNFIFSTYREFPQVYGKGTSMAASTKFQAFSQQLGVAKGEVSYFDVNEALKFLESFIALVQDITAQGQSQEASPTEGTEQMPSLQTTSFQTFVDEVRPYLSPLQGFLFQVTAEDYDFDIEGFVGIGNEGS